MSREESPVIDLSLAPGEGEAWGRPRVVVYLWAAAELIFVTNPWQVSSRLRVAVLKLFGAEIGQGVIFRPRTRVKFPWKLRVGDRSWVGEGVWIHNQDHVTVGSDVVLSQEALVTTGSHALQRDMALITRPVVIEDGAWVTTRCIVLGGTRIGQSAVLTPNTVAGPNADITPGVIFGAPAPTVRRDRFATVDLKARAGQ
jgi:putative colanic acid biosynthesis acetyltransferase WcaF